jgi:hypothetical protein
MGITVTSWLLKSPAPLRVIMLMLAKTGGLFRQAENAHDLAADLETTPSTTRRPV